MKAPDAEGIGCKSYPFENQAAAKEKVASGNLPGERSSKKRVFFTKQPQFTADALNQNSPEATMLTDQEIERGKREAPTSRAKYHEHNDCIRIAYEWLDAQVKTKGISNKTRLVKDMIESWGGRYVSTDDVHVAAWLHPKIRGAYPRYNISARLTRPSAKRLLNIGEAGKHPNYQDRFLDSYTAEENLT